MSRALNLPDCNETKVYEAAIRILRDYPPLSCVGLWVTWQGEGRPEADLPDNGAPAVRLLPVLRGAGQSRGLFTSADQVVLDIGVEMRLPTLYAADALNFWGAVRDAFNRPGEPDAGKAVIDELRAAGAEPAVATFAPPTPVSADEGTGWHLLGSIQFAVRYDIS